MSAADSLDTLLDRAVSEGASVGEAKPSELELARARRDMAMPRELATLYARADGLAFRHVELFDLADFADVNGDETLFAQLGGSRYPGA